MKVTLLLVCVLTAVFSGFGIRASAIDKADIDSIVAGNNSFAFDLYRQLARDKGNLFFSPYSISSALAMTYAGARGETAKQMADVLHFSLAPERLHPVFSDLTGMFNAGGKSYQLSVANALWGQVGYKFLPGFLDITNKYYGAGFKEVDYVKAREQARQTINKWVEAKTNDKIKNLIQPDDLSTLTRLVLTNAIYFKGKWEIQFKPEATKPMPFYMSAKEKVDVPMMHQVAKFNYAENDQAQILEMPYTGGDLSMVVLLPKPGYELAKLEDMLRPEVIRSWLSQLSKKEVEVFLPRFKLEERFVLNEELHGLGMIDAFDKVAADFSGMTPGPDLYISMVIHKAFVEVNEEGTEAAAATAVIMDTKAMILDKPPVFRADRPFVFLVRDLRSGSILFMGRLANPAK
ncbi:MAG: serpin family protein [Bacillota bacterium]